MSLDLSSNNSMSLGCYGVNGLQELFSQTATENYIKVQMICIYGISIQMILFPECSLSYRLIFPPLVWKSVSFIALRRLFGFMNHIASEV